MSYRADKQVIDTHTDTHTHTDRYTDRGDDNTRRPKLASGKKLQATYRVTKCGVESLRVLLKFLVWEGFPIFVNQVVGSVNNTAIHLVCGWKETQSSSVMDKSLRLSDAYMRWESMPTLVQIMACRLFGAKPLSEPMLTYCRLGPQEKISINFLSEKIFIHALFDYFHPLKCIWISCLPNGGHFLHSSMCPALTSMSGHIGEVLRIHKLMWQLLENLLCPLWHVACSREHKRDGPQWAGHEIQGDFVASITNHLTSGAAAAVIVSRADMLEKIK